MKEYPKTLYRPAKAGGIEHRSFQAEADIPEGEGWTDFKSAKAAATPEPVVPTRDSRETERLQKQIAELTGKHSKAKGDLVAAQIGGQQARADLGAATGRIGELETFLRLVANDPNSPTGLKSAIEDMLEPAPAKQAKAIKATIAKRSDKAKPQD